MVSMGGKLTEEDFRRKIIYLRDGLIYRLIKSGIIYRKNEGTYIMDEGWDNLIILDACRYDVFSEFYQKNEIHKGILESRISRGADTTSFLIENFKRHNKAQLDEIVYVAANPFVNKLLEDVFFKIIPIWKFGWNENYGTVLPSTVYRYALDAYMRYPDKKIIVHFLQPHYPYLSLKKGDESLEILRKSVLEQKEVGKSKKTVDPLFTRNITDVYSRFTRKEHLTLYKKNLEFVLPYVNNLADLFPGTTVVTADHGESFGEFIHPLIPIKLFGHTGSIRTKVLTEIPWLIIRPEDKNKKKIQSLMRDIEKIRKIRKKFSLK